MVNPKNLFKAFVGFLVAVSTFFSQPVFASQNQYFDYGPYYSTPSVLGLSLSSLENLPVPKIPDNLMPAPAKGILPGNLFYGLERAWENTQVAFTFNPVAKEELRLKQAEERLSEAKSLMDQGKIQAASQALGDYGRTINDIAENLTAIAKINTPASQDLINKVEQAAAAQTVAATALSLSTTPAQAENWTDAGNASRDVLDKIAESRGEPAIPENLSTGLQQLKEQGLISEEESNKIYGLKNRSEVREELIRLNSSGGLPPSEIARLDEGVSKYYPEVQNQQIANWQIVELRSYQARTQPTQKQIEEMEKWQDNPNTPPSNDIKPYLWYNRARDLAKEVDLSNFSENQQADLSKYYSQIQDNPTYSPPPTPSPSPAPVASPSSSDDQTVTPSPLASPSPSATPVPADPYLQDPGALPGQPTYIIKQFGETFSSALTFNATEKARLRFEQSERRLAEAAALSKDPKKAGLYESALKAYRETLADASNKVKNLPEGREARKAAEKLEAQASRHEVIFEKGLLPAPAKNPKLLAEVIKTTEDALDKSADALGRPAVPPILASRLDDLKAQGLILEEEVQNLVNSNSREETREKVRELVEQKGFPLADAKKLDEAQSRISPADYNQLVEVRKVEELQNLRAVQTDLAQTPTLKAQVSTLGQKEAILTNSFDPSLIKPEDLKGRENLVKAYDKLSSIARPINGGQFGAEATPGAQPIVTPPAPGDAALTTCPEGATFKQSEGCVWAETGKKINDYDQYKCDGPGQYYSFAAKKCVDYDPTKGYQEDSQPICPVGYQWSWQSQSCQTSTGGILPYPSPSAEPEPKDDQEREERSKSCPEGSSYQAPNGCVWDDNGKSVYDPQQYRCNGRGQYYSFEEHKCVAAPKEGEAYPKDTAPVCKEQGTFWNWSVGKCLPPPQSSGDETRITDEVKPAFVARGNPLYFLKQAGERAQQFLAFTPQAKEQVSLAHAKERLAEAIDALKKNDEKEVKNALNSYTTTMQNLVSDLSKQNLGENTKKEIGKRLSEQAAEQNLLLQKLQALAPAEQDIPISAAVSASILGVDKAADIAGKPAIPDEVKSKIESLPEDMISEEDKKTLLETDSRVDARLKLSGLIQNGALTQTDSKFLNEDFDAAPKQAKLKVEELKKLEEIATASDDKEKLVEKVTKNEEIAQKLQEFENTFEVGKEVPAEIRPYVRLTRINEVAQTVRPDIVRLEDFQNRKDVLLAVATLQEEFKPTKESWARVEDYRRRNPYSPLPPELARIEALSFSLGVRNQAESCYLPTPPFPANTPCPAPGAAIPITSYASYNIAPAYEDSGSLAPARDKDGKPFVYGQGPATKSAGICPDGYHWMYDSGGWCMNNTGNYSSSYNYTPTGPQTAGYTPYSPYYNAPGAPPATYGYPTGGSFSGSPYSYSPPSYYGPGSTAYTTTPPPGTVPGSGPRPTAPGRCPSGFHWMSDSGGWCMADGPTYVAPGAYPTGTATSGTPPPGGYNCGSQPYDPITKKCKDGACPGGFNWDGSKCVSGGYSSSNYIYSGSSYPSCPPGQYYSNGTCVNSSTGSVNCGSGYSWNGYSCQPSSGQGSTCTYPAGGCPGVGAWYDYSSCSCKTTTSGGSYYSPSSYQYGCTPGYYWNGSKCVAGSNEGSGWSDTAARSQSWCQPPSNGCGSNSYWDYGSCYCRSSSTYYGGSGPSPSNQCQGLSCGGGAWLDYSTCSCKYSGGSGTTPTGSPITCYPPSAGCPGGWYDYGTCSCKTSYSGTSSGSGGSSYCSPPGGGCGSGWWDSASCSCRQASSQGCSNVSASSCGSGWYFDSAACTCRQSSTSSGSTSGGTSSGGSSTGSCPSGYHWMSENGGYCMQDGGGGGGSTSTSTTTSQPSTSEPAPAPTSAPASEPAPAPPSEPAPAPSGG
ncbi:hypothetical protein HYS95_02555 [Candidatus Daviesbacteria bacterium]|nr:hypothetical protein [Candidatus Daviesbacteria bacterium]